MCFLPLIHIFGKIQNYYHLDESISNLKVDGCIFVSTFSSKVQLIFCEEPDQMLHSVGSDPGMHS